MSCDQCLVRKAIVKCGDDCGTAFYCGQDCANAHYAEHKIECIEARAHRRKSSNKSRKDAKIRKVMREFKRGTLRSGSGHIVTSRKQALAIALSEARRMGDEVMEIN